MRTFYEKSSSGLTVRKMLRTPDSRRLAKDILAIFSKEASSSVGRDAISLYDQRQLLPRDLLRQNLENWTLGRKALLEVDSLGRLERLKSLLSGIEITLKESPDSSKLDKRKVRSPDSSSDTINYFLSRRMALDTILSIFKDFADANSITSLLGGVDQSAIKDVIHLLDGLAQLEIPDAYAVISDAELAINEKFQKGRRNDQYAAKSIIENQVGEIATALKMNLDEESRLKKAVLENL